MKQSHFYLLLLLQFFISTEARIGVDVSQLVSTNSFQCFQSSGYDFAIVRAFRSSGVPDSTAPSTILNAHRAGIPIVDAYMFPCPKCVINAQVQVQDMISLNLDVNMIWLDVELNGSWLDDKNKNRAFFEDLVAALQKYFPTGVYTSSNNWSNIMGLSYTGGSSFPLWYAHYDGAEGFNDFKPFGGWQRPTMKQFAENLDHCETPGFDVNWRP